MRLWKLTALTPLLLSLLLLASRGASDRTQQVRTNKESLFSLINSKLDRQASYSTYPFGLVNSNTTVSTTSAGEANVPNDDESLVINDDETHGTEAYLVSSSELSQTNQSQLSTSNSDFKQLFLRYLSQKASKRQQPPNKPWNKVLPLVAVEGISAPQTGENLPTKLFNSSSDNGKLYNSNSSVWIKPQANGSVSRTVTNTLPDQLLKQIDSSVANSNLQSYFTSHHSKHPCGGNVTISTSYEISSPNYPNKYSPNSDCQWDIYTEKDQVLRVQIFKLSIEQDVGCRFDYLDIREYLPAKQKTGKYRQNTKRFCGNYLKGKEFVVSSNHTTIVFHSDSSTESNGFHMRVIAESEDCESEVFVYNYTYLTSPKYPQLYGDSKNCWTQITTMKDHRLLVDFEDLQLESDVNCSYDYVEVFDGTVANHDLLMGRFCKLPTESSVLLHSTHKWLLFHFESDNYLSLRGYKARVIALRKDVNMSSYNNCNWSADWKNMTIYNPFYPRPYPANTVCETSISSYLPDERIMILFDWIDLLDEPALIESTNYREKNTMHINCTLDRLEIYELVNDTQPSNVFCGNHSQQFMYISKGNSIRLVFKSASIDHESHNNSRPRTYVLENSGQNATGFRARFVIMSSKEINFNKRKNSISSKQDSKEQFLIRKPENATVMLGSSHILYCEVNSGQTKQTLQTSINWFKGDREIHTGVSHDGTSLLIKQFRPQSVGRYICVYGDNSSDAWLSLKEDTPSCSSSSVLFRERPKDQYTSEGEFVMLHCSVTLANSSVEEDIDIDWEKLPLHYTDTTYGQKLMKPQPVEFENSRIKKLRRGDLLFDPALIEDSGYYFCVVRFKNHKALHQPSESQFMERLVSNKSIPLLSEGELKNLDHKQNGEPERDDERGEEEEQEEDEDCVMNSAARVQINQRVDISQYCGKTHMHKNTDEALQIENIGKVIGGTEASRGEFPWMVMFWDEKRHVFCGGALLNERWVVTAAHCFTDTIDESTVFVKLGKFDQTMTESNEIVTKIQHIIKHPHFSKDTFDNDIALVKLVKHIIFTDFILPICIANSPEEILMVDSHFFSSPQSDNGDLGETKFGYVTGWGRLKENGPLPRYLHKIRLPIVDQYKCRTSTSFKVTDSMFCAGYGKEIVGDACKGDSGGPFAVQFDSRWILLGIVSWGEGCGRPEKYGYYTKVNNYNNWIRKMIRLAY